MAMLLVSTRTLGIVFAPFRRLNTGFFCFRQFRGALNTYQGAFVRRSAIVGAIEITFCFFHLASQASFSLHRLSLHPGKVECKDELRKCLLCKLGFLVESGVTPLVYKSLNVYAKIYGEVEISDGKPFNCGASGA